MARPFAVAFYHSTGWKHTRQSYMETPIHTDKGICPPGMCERCFSMGILKPAEIVHHRTHLSFANIDDPSITMGYGNLMRVCRDCHAVLHSDDPDYKPRVQFDEEGNVVPLG